MANSTASKTPAPAAKARVERTNEEKMQNFSDAAPARVDRILKAVASLRSIARPVRYAWSDAQRTKMFATLAAALTDAEASFRNPSTKAKSGGFSF